MKIKQQLFLFTVLGLFCLKSYAQQDAMFTHYMYNTLTVNPAYAGSRDALTLTALHRSQWVSFKGAPETQTITLHTPIKSKKIGLGFSAITDKIGPVKTTGVYADFAYVITTGNKGKLAFGLKGGVSVMQAALSELKLDEQSDPTFQNNIKNDVLPNFGFGMYYYRERFYSGISIPRLLENIYKASAPNGSYLASEKRHYFVIAGAVFKISDNIQFKPTALIKATNGAPVELDVTPSFIINKKLFLGAMYRTGDAAGLLIGLNITEQLYFGYSYDFSFGIRTLKYNSGSHEIVLRYDFIYKDKGKIHSPRFF